MVATDGYCKIFPLRIKVVLTVYSPVVAVCITRRRAIRLSVHTICLRSSYGTHERHRLFLYTSLNTWFCDWDGECLLRGTDWIFIYNSSYSQLWNG